MGRDPRRPPRQPIHRTHQSGQIMRLPVNYQIAATYLYSQRKQTIVAILGVTFGISMYVFMNSFMRGVNEAQNRLAFSTLAHVRIYNDRPADRSNLVSLAFPKNTIA